MLPSVEQLRRYWLPFSFLFFFVLGVFIAYPSLSNYWFNDDLFLVRTFTPDELNGAFAGDWDPSGISTPAYRPLTDGFNHVTSLVFGEHVVLHRLFRIAMFALYLVAFAQLAVMLDARRWIAILAGLLILVTKNTWWLLVWNADGIRTFAGFLGISALLLALAYLKTGKLAYIVGALLIYAIALLTRDENIIFLLLFLLIGASITRWRLSRPLVISGVAFMVVTAVYWLLRTLLVAGLQTSFNPLNFVWALLWVVAPRFPVEPILFWIALVIVMWAAIVVMLRLLATETRRLLRVPVLAMLLTLSTAVLVLRANTLLLPISFFSLFVAMVAGEFIEVSRRRLAPPSRAAVSRRRLAPPSRLEPRF